MLEASGAAGRVEASLVPMLPGALDLAQRGVVSGGTGRNHAWLNPTTDWGALTQPEQLVLADAQTSGGLLIATRHPEALRVALDAGGVAHAEIGEIVAGEPGRIRVDGRLPT
jgi:selenophosphate synthase